MSEAQVKNLMTESDTGWYDKPYNCWWTEDRIRFMRDAYEEVRFHEVLAKRAAAYIEKNDSVCDCGCGLGYISMELCRYAEHVTAVDIQERPLQILRAAAKDRGIGNLNVLNEDIQGWISDIDGSHIFDHLVCSFFGQIPEIVSLGKVCAAKTLILFRKCWGVHRLSREEIPLSQLRFRRDCEMLDEMGIRYETEEFDLDMGQPLRSIEDAVTYFRAYSRDEDVSVITEDFVRQKLVKGSSDKFPYYYPMPGKVGMIVIRTDDIIQ